MTKIFTKKFPSQINPKALEVAVLTDYRVRLGSKDIMHLEAYVASMMVLVRQSKH